MASVVADFAAADDLLREAGQGRLAGHGSIVLQKSGRIGPLVEIALAAMTHDDQYRGVSVNSLFAAHLNQALQSRCPFGSSFNDCAGAFPLSAVNPVTSTGLEWDQWTTHAENIAKAICRRGSWEAFVPADYLTNESVSSVVICCEWHDSDEDMDEFYRQTVYRK